jgi:hypothetical protein
MVFSDTTNLTGLIQDCEQRLFGDGGFGKITGDTVLLKQFTNRLNRAYDRYVSLAIRSDGRWQFDSSNYTDFPIGVTNLITDQQDYAFAVEHVTILGVEVQDEAGNWSALTEIDQRAKQFEGLSISEYYKDTSGIPIKYDKVGNSVFLYPKPNYDKTGGLKVHFQRGPDYFEHTDTTKVPGFQVMHHPYLTLQASASYALDRGLTLATDLNTLVNQWEQVEIPTFYSRRAKDVEVKLKPVINSSR